MQDLIEQIEALGLSVSDLNTGELYVPLNDDAPAQQQSLIDALGPQVTITRFDDIAGPLAIVTPRTTNHQPITNNQ